MHVFMCASGVCHLGAVWNNIAFYSVVTIQFRVSDYYHPGCIMLTPFDQISRYSWCRSLGTSKHQFL